MNRHDTIGIDLVAMSVNDLIVQGAEPLFFLDYFATSKLEVEIGLKTIQGIAEGCRVAQCALMVVRRQRCLECIIRASVILLGLCWRSRERKPYHRR